jgi:2Fe-2S ferredoxin
VGHIVRVEPSGRQFEADPGETLMGAANRCALQWPTLCHGQGTCTLCHCRILDGTDNLAPAAEREVEQLGLVMGRFPGVDTGEVRLACQAKVQGPVVVRKAGVRPRTES